MFQLSPLARHRNYLIQAVPQDFKTRFFRSPILAVWRGVGNSIHGGFPAVALCLASTYSSRERYDTDFFHILSYHQTQATWGAPRSASAITPSPRVRLAANGGAKGAGRSFRRSNRSSVDGVLHSVLGHGGPAGGPLRGLPPSGRPPQSLDRGLFGWRCEVGRDLKPFRDGLAPDEALLSPVPSPSSRASRGTPPCGWPFFQQDETTKTLYLTDGHTRYKSTAALMQISSATTHQDADIPGLASVLDCYRLMRPAGPAPQRKPSALPSSSMTRAEPRTPHPSYAEVVVRPNPGLADAVTQISASRDPILLQRASQLIVEHIRPMEQTLQCQQATIRALQLQVEQQLEQVTQAQATGTTALELMVRQEQMITTLQVRAEEDRQSAYHDRLRFQAEQAASLAFRNDVQAALLRLGLPGPPPPFPPFAPAGTSGPPPHS